MKIQGVLTVVACLALVACDEAVKLNEPIVAEGQDEVLPEMEGYWVGNDVALSFLRDDGTKRVRMSSVSKVPDRIGPTLRCGVSNGRTICSFGPVDSMIAAAIGVTDGQMLASILAATATSSAETKGSPQTIRGAFNRRQLLRSISDGAISFRPAFALGIRRVSREYHNAEIASWKDPDAAHCDELAGSFIDPFAVKRIEKIADFVAAVSACSAARQSNPDHPRFAYQLARTYFQGGEAATARNWANIAANLNYPAGRYLLGVLDLQAASTPERAQMAVQSLKMAAERGVYQAEVVLGQAFLRPDRGLLRDEVEGIRWIEQAARHRNPSGLYELARLNQEGAARIPKNSLKALEFFQQAADAPNASPEIVAASAVQAGWLLEGGEKPELAFGWYERAAKLNSPHGSFHLGRLQHLGKGTPLDYAAAAKSFEQAAQTGHTAAQVFLGFQYRFGLGVQENHGEASDLFRRAAGAGSFDGMYWLGKMGLEGTGRGPKGWTAEWWLKRAAEEGRQERAILELGLAYFNGIEGSRNYSLANEWLAKVPNQPKAKLALAFINEAGQQGFKKDLDRAEQYYRSAFEFGDASDRNQAQQGIRRIDAARKSNSFSEAIVPVIIGGLVLWALSPSQSSDGESKPSEQHTEPRREHYYAPDYVCRAKSGVVVGDNLCYGPR